MVLSAQILASSSNWCYPNEIVDSISVCIILEFSLKTREMKGTYEGITPDEMVSTQGGRKRGGVLEFLRQSSGDLHSGMNDV